MAANADSPYAEYLNNSLLSWAETPDEIITRGEAVRRMYDDLRPAGEDAPNFPVWMKAPLIGFSWQ